MVETFGAGTIEYKRYYTAQYFYYPISMAGPVSGYQIVEALSKERLKSIQLLDSAVTYLREKLEEIGETPALIADDDDDQSRLSSRKVFIVHGHDEGMKEGVARFLSAIGFDPIILHEQPNKGRTIIHKFREVAQTAGFAVVLLSPDDETTASQRRARQNVILELGFFLGALGPERVAALKKGDVETPSDFDGVIYTAYEGNWKSALATELQAVGYEIDWNKVMKP
ncbi:nucleotide-binding protein [Rhizobium sp. AG855]|uniref:TIR domain-containing protein n=1 Tax=Rhizobium sp. AG855 TaxID=2183898 RepID=UPI001FE06AEF|nr:nucleotide-binding protein [Rhizobium sp. AG855]